MCSPHLELHFLLQLLNPLGATSIGVGLLRGSGCDLAFRSGFGAIFTSSFLEDLYFLLNLTDAATFPADLQGVLVMYLGAFEHPLRMFCPVKFISASSFSKLFALLSWLSVGH